MCDVCVMFAVLRGAIGSIPSMVILLFSNLDADKLVKHILDGHSANFTSELFVFPRSCTRWGHQKVAAVAPVFVGVDLRRIMRGARRVG